MAMIQDIFVSCIKKVDIRRLLLQRQGWDSGKVKSPDTKVEESGSVSAFQTPRRMLRVSPTRNILALDLALQSTASLDAFCYTRAKVNAVLAIFDSM